MIDHKDWPTCPQCGELLGVLPNHYEGDELDGFYAACSDVECEWEGPLRATPADALNDYADER